MTYDVITVGAGPAGATLGRELARRGINTVILEKAHLPRYKPCAGGLPARTLRFLDFDVTPVVERAIYGVVFSRGCEDRLTQRSTQPLLYTVMRDRFDAFLVEEARAAGARVVEGQVVKHVEISGGSVRVITTQDVWSARVVAGADGAFSAVARRLGLMRGVPSSVAIEGEFNLPTSTLEAWDDTIALDLGTLPDGYGWLFPKREYLSIGVGGPHRQGRRLKTYHRALLEARLGDVPRRPQRLTGHILTHRWPGMAIYWGPVLLLGDAAGLTDPWNGEGIYYAIRSAQLAAPAIERALTDGESLQAYERSVDEELMPDLLTARICGWVYHLWPGLFLRQRSHNARVWRAFCALLQKGTAYARIRERIPPVRMLVRRWLTGH